MRTEYHHWHSPRTGQEMGIVVFGHYGPPLLGFPTSAGGEWELHDQGLVGALADFIDAGRVKIFTIDSINNESFYNKGAHPFHRSWMQKQFDEYVRFEVVPFIHNHCQSQAGISTVGMSFGAYHAANTLFKHPDVIKRCFAISGMYDVRNFLDGLYDDNLYFNNPVDYLQNLSDPWFYEQYASCDIHIVTGNGPWENPGPSQYLSDILNHKGIRHSFDHWGAEGGHDWPYWKRQMREYIGKLFW